MPVTSYQIPQVVNCTVADTLAETKMTMNFPIGRADFQLTQGVNNQIDFFVRDIDRHPATLDPTMTVQIIIIDPLANVTLMTRSLTLFSPVQSIYRLLIKAYELLDWPVGNLAYSLSLVAPDGSRTMLWTTMNYLSGGTILLVPGPIPDPSPSISVSPNGFLYAAPWAVSARFACAAQQGYSNGAQTFVLPMVDFTGMVRIEGSINASAVDEQDWYVLLQKEYTLMDGTDVLTTRGNHLWLRISIGIVIDPAQSPSVGYRIGQSGSLGTISVKV